MDTTDYRNAPAAETRATGAINTMDAPLAETVPAVAIEAPLQADLVTTEGAASEAKRALRARLRAVRDALPERERHAAERRITERLLAHPDVERARTVLLYAHHGSEVATDELAKALLRQGKALVYPKMTGVAGLMTLWRVRTLDALVPHKHGIRAPDVTRASPTEPAAVDCVIYPGLAFTRTLARLGQGGGYYDRLSAKLPPHCVRIGVAFEVQLVGFLPREAHDADLHWLVTEATVYPFVPEPLPKPAAPGSGETAATPTADTAAPNAHPDKTHPASEGAPAS